jgi:hypothetical protein
MEAIVGTRTLVTGRELVEGEVGLDVCGITEGGAEEDTGIAEEIDTSVAEGGFVEIEELKIAAVLAVGDELGSGLVRVVVDTLDVSVLLVISPLAVLVASTSGATKIGSGLRVCATTLEHAAPLIAPTITGVQESGTTSPKAAMRLPEQLKKSATSFEGVIQLKKPSMRANVVLTSFTGSSTRKPSRGMDSSGDLAIAEPKLRRLPC